MVLIWHEGDYGRTVATELGNITGLVSVGFKILITSATSPRIISISKVSSRRAPYRSRSRTSDQSSDFGSRVAVTACMTFTVSTTPAWNAYLQPVEWSWCLPVLEPARTQQGRRLNESIVKFLSSLLCSLRPDGAPFNYIRPWRGINS